MNLTVIAVDKLREPYAREGCAIYAAKLAPYLPPRVIEVKPQSIEAEGRAMLARLDADSLVWALDREGVMLSSPELARELAAAQRSGRRRLTVLIGGAEGLQIVFAGVALELPARVDDAVVVVVLDQQAPAPGQRNFRVVVRIRPRGAGRHRGGCRDDHQGRRPPDDRREADWDAHQVHRPRPDE